MKAKYYVFPSQESIIGTNGDPDIMEKECLRSFDTMDEAKAFATILYQSDTIQYADIDIAYYDYESCKSKLASFYLEGDQDELPCVC